MNLRNFKSTEERRRALSQKLNITLNHTGKFTLDEKSASTHNCENMIGAVQVPLGVAGPLKIKEFSPVNEYYVPLATTEGALVASVNRGARAITASGGASVEVYRAGVTRGPVFRVNNLSENSRLYEFLESHQDDIRKISQSTSSHLGYLSYTTNSVGLYRFVRFSFDTSDAMGMNMVTIATDAVCRFIREKTGAELVSLSGNYCSDKKASWLNFTAGRGYEVWAEAVISADTLKEVLKTDANNFYETWLAKCMIGSAMSGSLGFNAHFANVLSALFIATGQDPAHVAECSVGITTARVVPEDHENDLYVSIYLPDLMVGTVGGGTALSTQIEALSIMGIAGGNDGANALKFAGITGAAVLAGELSLLASLSAGSLAESHRKLGRGGK